MLGDKYRIQISVPGKGLSDTAFVNNVLEWSFEKEDGQIYYRKKIASPLVFRDDIDLNKTDFTDLYKLERSRASRCDKIDVIIFKKCFGGAETQYWNGYLSLIDGKWNKSTCEVEIIPRPQDQYTCLYENWEKDINILNFNIDRYDARSTIGTIEYKDCSRTTLTEKNTGIPAYADMAPCITQAEIGNSGKGWTLVRWDTIEGVSVSTTWAREVFIGDQPGPDWKDDGGKWVRSVEVVEDLLAYLDEGGRLLRRWKIVQYTLTNGLKLTDVLPEMLREFASCQYTLVSNYFGIAPDGTAPTNRAYDKAFDHLRNLYIYAKQDVRRAKDKDQSSTFIKDLSFKRIAENLKVLFNAYFIIEEDTSILRLEHISYFNDRRMLDLTQERFLDDIDGKWKYSYIKESLPIREVFKFMEPTTPSFDGLSITYGESCSNDDKKSNESTYAADFVVTAVDDIVENPDKYSTDGIVLVEIAPAGYIVGGRTTLDTARNGNLSWYSLQDFYHRWNRPQEYGTMNGQNTRFETFKRTRKQEPIQLQLCCSDFEQFNPLDLVRTQLGWGEILSARYSDPSEQLTLELLHD